MLAVYDEPWTWEDKDLTLYTLTLRTLYFILDGGAFLHYKFYP